MYFTYQGDHIVLLDGWRGQRHAAAGHCSSAVDQERVGCMMTLTMKTQTSTFHVEDYLNSEDDVTAYLNAALQEAASIADDEQSSAYFLAALGDAAKAEQKMASIARRSDVGRESLYKSLRAESNPSFRTVFSAIRELGGQLSITKTKTA